LFNVTVNNILVITWRSEEFEGTKGVRMRKSKDRQHNGQKKKNRQHNGQM